MEKCLDFTKLNNMPKTNRQNEPQSDFSTDIEQGVSNIKKRLKTENKGFNNIEPLQEPILGKAALSRLTKTQLEEQNRQAVFKEYQENIRASSQIQIEILKGVKAGEDIGALLLKACKGISLMTSNQVFFDQVEEDLKHLYGDVFKQPYFLEVQLEEAKERLKLLERAHSAEPNEIERRRLAKALSSHQQEIERIEALLK